MRLIFIYIFLILLSFIFFIQTKRRNHQEYDDEEYDHEEYDYKKVIIYILCHNKEKYKFAKKHFKKYKWARPILMKYQDITWENAFWKQLSEIEDEWKDADMVGTLSPISYTKIDIESVNDIILNETYKYPYHHFMDTNSPAHKSAGMLHPYFLEIWNYMIEELELPNVTESYCNYWMCSPEYMKKFIEWYHSECLPTLLRNPLSYEDAKYGDSKMTEEQLIQKWGKPYFPHIPFILERIHKAFFVKHANL